MIICPFILWSFERVIKGNLKDIWPQKKKKKKGLKFSGIMSSSILLQDELEKVQKRAARFVTGNYVDYETGSMTGILKNLKWESLKKRRKDSRLIMLYKGLKGAASIPTNDLVPPIRRTRNHHSLAFQIPMAGTDIYKSSFFPQTIRDWNLVTDSLITASECAVDSVTKFTSLVRARD